MRIKEFQDLMYTLYYQNDNKRGIYRTTIWLGEEIGELMSELKKSEEKFKKAQIAEEMADVYAWIASLANLLDIDLESAIKKKYNHRCPRCSQNPYICEKNFPYLTLFEIFLISDIKTDYSIFGPIH